MPRQFPLSFSSSTPPSLLLRNFRILLHSYAGADISLLYFDSPCKRVRVAQSSRGSSFDWWRGASGGSPRARARPRSSFLLLACGIACPSRTTRRRTPRCWLVNPPRSARSFAIRRACARRKETQLVKYTTSTASGAASPRQASARRSSGRRCCWLAAAEDPARSSAASFFSWPPRASRRTTP